MVVLSKPAMEQFCLVKNCKAPTLFPGVPLIDLSKPDSKHLLVKACQEFGFFKVINHGVPTEFITKLESEVIKFFSLPLSEKEKAGPPDPFGYGNKKIGLNGDIGWVEYILLTTNSEFNYRRFESVFGMTPEKLRDAVNDYVSSVKKMACEILELMAEGLNIQPKNVFSKPLMDEQSDSVFRLNHYPPCPDLQELHGRNLIGFGEHTDPQIISVLRSNNTSGLQIQLNDGSWISIPPDQSSFFINVGDSMQKFVLKLDLQDDKEKRKALKIVSALAGIDEIAIDLKGKKLTVIGTVDPVTVASKLRKYWQTHILLVGPAKEPEKKEEAKKEEPKKEEAKKEEAKEEAKKEEPKKEEGKKEEPKKEEEKKADPAAAAPAPAPAPAPMPMPMPMPMQMQMPVVGTAMPYRPSYYPPMQTYYQVHHSMEENPNACVIC